MTAPYTRDTHLDYVEVNCAELDEMVWLGVAYEPGSPGRHTMANGDPGYPDEPPQMEVCEVWFRGADIGHVLLESVAQQLEAAAWDRIGELDQERREAQDEARAEARDAWRMQA